MEIKIIFLSSLILNIILFLNYKTLAKINNIYDLPDNKRKIHKLPVPLIGGLIIYVNVFVYLILDLFLTSDFTIIFRNTIQVTTFIIAVSLFFFLGLVDDKKDLNSFIKFIIMTIFLIILIILDKDLLIETLNFSFIDNNINLKNYSYFFTILCFLLFVNAFNMLDGIDGQAGTYTLTIFIILINRDIYSSFLIFLGLNLLFFIFYNLKKLMFLGDSGSLILGFLISYIFIKSYNQGYIIHSDEIYLFMCIPGYELLRLFIKRISIGKNPFSADRNHLHHYLIKKFSFPKTFLIMQILFFFPILSYFLLKNFYISLLISLISYLLIIFLITKKNRFIY